MPKHVKVTPPSVTKGAEKLLTDGAHAEVMAELVRICVMMAIEAPVKAHKESTVTQVRWQHVFDIRAVLKTAGVDIPKLQGVLKKISTEAVQNALPAKTTGKNDRIKSGPTRANA